MKFKVGDRVRIEIPNDSKDGPEFRKDYGNRRGKIIYRFPGGTYKIEFSDHGVPAEAVWDDRDLVLEDNGVQEMIKCL
jgi:ribosomal protein L21E